VIGIEKFSKSDLADYRENGFERDNLGGVKGRAG
jgi:hypothetical protein